MSMEPDSSATPYAEMGGAEGIRRLVHRFYSLMDTLPEAWDVRQMHPEDLSGSEEKLFKYLTGWLGGPPLYEQEFGHPRLRARHLPFTIASPERDQWLMCMRIAFDECLPDTPLRSRLWDAIVGLADHMRNRADPPA